jgi:hypothetical protein
LQQANSVAMSVTDKVKDALPETVKETVGLQSSGGPSTRAFIPNLSANMRRAIEVFALIE